MSTTIGITSENCGVCGTALNPTMVFCPGCGTHLVNGRAAVDPRELFRKDVIASFAELYRIERELGSGGASTVFLARDLRRDCDVALKVLRPDIAVSLQDRFVREIDITRSLRHPNILPLYDSGSMSSSAALGGAYWYFTAPFVRGGTLSQRLGKDGKLPIPEALAIATSLSDALGYAHERHVLHRDVKPSNVFLADDGRVLLADFGVARAMQVNSDRENITATGTFVGTPNYMSPEQMAGERRMDGRADQYSLACLIYEMLTGSPPFVEQSMHQLLWRHLHDRPASMRTVRDTIPPSVDAAVLRALEKSPADRFQSMAELAGALRMDRPGASMPMWGPLPDQIDDRSCFVIMPFSEVDHIQETYREHIVPAIESCGLKPYRADDIFGHREVIRDIWQAIGRARILIADVTGRNPNVFYELGMAHAIGKDVILLTQRGEDVPFDVTHLRYVKYEYTPRGVIKLREALVGTIQSLLRQQG